MVYNGQVQRSFTTKNRSKFSREVQHTCACMCVCVPALVKQSGPLNSVFLSSNRQAKLNAAQWIPRTLCWYNQRRFYGHGSKLTASSPY